MEILIAILIAIAFIAFIYWRRRANKNPFWHSSPVHRALKLIEGTPQITEDGVKVYYEEGARPIDHASADEGIRNAFIRAACRYSPDRSLMNFKIAVFKGEQAPESRDWAFRVPITYRNPYWNTEWDMMRGSKESVHYVLAAAQVAAVGQPYGDVMIVPDAPDPEYIKTVTDYETEHIILSWVDGDEFERTKTHTDGTGHPILPPCDGSFTQGKQFNCDLTK